MSETLQQPQSSAIDFSSSSSSSSAAPNSRRKWFKRRGGASYSSSVSATATSTLAKVSGSCDVFNAEKLAHVIGSAKAEDLENATEPEQQTTKSKQDNTPSLQTGTLEKFEEDSNAQSNSPLPLIPISRILKVMPQSPHFYQVRSYSEIAREKLVAAWDQTFEETVEQVHGLKRKDFWVSVSELWKTLEELQGMGYNVVPIRSRLVEMAEVMNELKQSELEIVTLKNKAENHRMERSRLQSVVSSLQLRAEREGTNMVHLLNEADKMEKELPKYDGLIANLAVKPFDANV